MCGNAVLYQLYCVTSISHHSPHPTSRNRAISSLTIPLLQNQPISRTLQVPTSMPPSESAPHRPLKFSTRSLSPKNISYDGAAEQGIAISLGLIFGVGALVLLLVIVCCIRRSKSLYHEPLFGGERDALSVEIPPGDNNMPYLKGCRGFFRTWCCGVIVESERDDVLCSGPHSGRGGGPARRGHHGSDRNLGNHGSDHSPRVSRRHHISNPPTVLPPLHSYRTEEIPGSSGGGGEGGRERGSGAAGNIHSNASRHESTNYGGHNINIIHIISPTDRLGRSTYRCPPSSRRRLRSPDVRRAGTQERGRPYPNRSGARQRTRALPETSSRERTGQFRSLSPDTHQPPVERQYGRGPPRRESGLVVSYPEAVYRGSGRGRGAPPDYEASLPPRSRRPPATWGFDDPGAGVPAQAHPPGAWPPPTSTVDTLGRERESYSANIGGSRTEDEICNNAPTTTGLRSGGSEVGLTHPGSLVDFTASAPASSSMLLSSPSLRSDTAGDSSSSRSFSIVTPPDSGSGYYTDAATWGSGRSFARPHLPRTLSESDGIAVYVPPEEITRSHSASSSLTVSSSDSHSYPTSVIASLPRPLSVESTASQQSHMRSTPRGFSTGYLSPRSSSETLRFSFFISTPRPLRFDTNPALTSPPSGDQLLAASFSEARAFNSVTAPSSLSGDQGTHTKLLGIMSRSANIPSSIYSGPASAEGEAPNIASVPERAAPRVDTRYWTTVESVADSDDPRE